MTPDQEKGMIFFFLLLLWRIETKDHKPKTFLGGLFQLFPIVLFYMFCFQSEKVDRFFQPIVAFFRNLF